MTRTCEGCGSTYEPRQRDQRFCTPACRQLARKSSGYDRRCEVCAETFHAQQPWARYCSPSCKAAAHRARRRKVARPRPAPRRKPAQAAQGPAEGAGRRAANADAVTINLVKATPGQRKAIHKETGRAAKLSDVPCERCGAPVPRLAVNMGDRYCSHDCAVRSNSAAMDLCPSVAYK